MPRLAALLMLVRQHAEDAALLFELRARSFHGHSWDDLHLGRFDQRLAANIAGLVAAGESGIELSLEYAETVGGAGEVFALAVTSFARGEHVDKALAIGLGTPKGRKGLSGALAWLDAASIGPHVKRWLVSEEPSLRLLALMALSHHRRDPGAALATLLNDPMPDVRSRSARLVFEMGRSDLVGPLQDLAKVEENDPWPALALARAGVESASLYEYASDPGRPRAGLALDFALLAAPERAREDLNRLMAQPATRALAVSRLGVLADRSLARWLLNQMHDANDAEAAVFAFLDLYPVDPDDCGQFLVDPDSVDNAADGGSTVPRPHPDAIERWLEALADAPPHRSLRLQTLDALRAGLRDRQAPMTNCRQTRAFPAWS